MDISVYENPLAEAEGTARRIRQYAQAGFAFEDMAVLFRTGNGTGLLAEKLMEYNIPFSMRDVIPSLYGHWIAKDLMAYLELGHGSRARSDFFRIMNRPNRYFSRDAFETPLCPWTRSGIFTGTGTGCRSGSWTWRGICGPSDG